MVAVELGMLEDVGTPEVVGSPEAVDMPECAEMPDVGAFGGPSDKPGISYMFLARKGERVMSNFCFCCIELLYSRVYTSSLALDVYAVETCLDGEVLNKASLSPKEEFTDGSNILFVM